MEGAVVLWGRSVTVAPQECGPQGTPPPRCAQLWKPVGAVGGAGPQAQERAADRGCTLAPWACPGRQEAAGSEFVLSRCHSGNLEK